MDKKIKEHDLLLVKEPSAEQVKAVVGVDEAGKLKTEPLTKEHQTTFLKIDKHSSAVENLLSNFMRQQKNPTHFGFFKVPAADLECDPTLVNDPAKLDQYKITPEQQAKSYKPIDAERIDWAQFERMGVTRESLEKQGALDKMLNYRKSPGLIPIVIKVDDLTVRTDARLSLKELPDGRIVPQIHAIQKAPQLDRPFYGNTFTDEDKKALRETGNLGRLIDLKIPGKEDVRVFVSVDKLTNDIIALDAKRVRIPEEIKGIKLNDEQKQKLSQGRAIYVEDMTSKTGKSFNATLQINADQRGVEFMFGNQLKEGQQQGQEQPRTQFQWVDDQGNIRAPKTLGGVELTEQQKEEFKQGKEIYMEGMLKAGTDKPYSAHIKFNAELGKPEYDFKKRQEQNLSQEQGETQQQKPKGPKI